MLCASCFSLSQSLSLRLSPVLQPFAEIEIPASTSKIIFVNLRTGKSTLSIQALMAELSRD
jgi:hypothetical protein